MYKKFFGLNEKPFQILSDPAYLFMSKAHEAAYTHLEYGILENKGFVVITGEIGSGKTTLINYLLEKIEAGIQVALINNTLVSSDNLLKMLCQDFEIDIRGLDESEIITTFYQFLVNQYAARKRVILIIDEAQNLRVDALEQIRMLSNFELDKQHLFQIILVGQPELRIKLRQKALEQLAQRVSVHYHLSGLSPHEVEAYVKHRLQIAGAKNIDIFLEDALDAICSYSKGIPRLINMLCDTALVYAFADGLKQVDRDIIEAVIRERDVGGFVGQNFQQTNETVSPESPAGGYDEGGGPSLAIERRVERLEHRLESLEKHIDFVSNHEVGRNLLIVELFKLLQENIKKRYRGLSHAFESKEV